MYECAGTKEEMINRHLSRFVLTEDEDGQQILKSQFTKLGHMLSTSINQETVEITLFDSDTHLNENSFKRCSWKQLKQVLKALIIQYPST